MSASTSATPSQKLIDQQMFKAFDDDDDDDSSQLAFQESIKYPNEEDQSGERLSSSLNDVTVELIRNAQPRTGESAVSPEDQLKTSGQNNSNINGSHPPGKTQLSRNQENSSLREQFIDQDNQQMDQIPLFAQPRYCKDSNQRPRSHPDYDPTTLYIPFADQRNFTNVKRQYWQFKSQHFDKIIFFKLGKFYEIFYEDALVCQKVLDLTLTNKQLHCGFPEKSMGKFAAQLVKVGYKVVVVEQVNRKQDKNNVLEREIVQIITKSTINFAFEEQNSDPKYLLAIRQYTNLLFGIVVYESLTGKIQVGVLEDDKTQTHLKTFLCVLKPTEIVYDPANITTDIMKLLKSDYFQAAFTPIYNYEKQPETTQWKDTLAYHYLEKQFGTSVEDYPTELKDARGTSPELAELAELKYSTLAGFFSFMKYMLRLDNILESSEFIPCDFDNQQFTQRMVLDSQALQHLEILENSQVSMTTEHARLDTQIGTVLNYLDYTRTPYGKRLMKKWVCAPLIDIAAINDRLDALEDIQNNIPMKEQFQDQIAQYADIERLCSAIYRYSVKQTHYEKAMMYENISGIHLNEFKMLVKNLYGVERLIEGTFMANSETFKSIRLRRLTTYKRKNEANQQGDLERVSAYLKAMETYIDLDSQEKIAGRIRSYPVPRAGIMPEYDQIKASIAEITDELERYLLEIQTKFGTKEIVFSFYNNRQYDLEMPKSLIEKKKPADWVLQSARGQNFVRYSTPYITERVAAIEQYEYALKDHLQQFSITLFREFYNKKEVWDKFVSIVAELDCLVSLSHASFTVADGVMCRPVIKFAKSQKETFFNLKQGRNPNLSQLGGNQIPNDIQMGNISTDRWKPTIMILTGPNMGGKSTTLRLFCTVAIIAQIGCYVPAQVCEFSLVDRIFTRIGAGDKLIEGKSTFYIEMEEVKNSLMYGTYNSLAIFDELGRGTSTFDGVAIAYGILKYFIEKVQSRCIFATHFFLLINELRFYKEISFFHMEYFYDNKTHKLIFKYKLKSGNADSSFGIELAKIVGIDNSILKRAEEKRNEFESSMQYGEVYQQQKLTQYNGLISKLFTYENRHK